MGTLLTTWQKHNLKNSCWLRYAARHNLPGNVIGGKAYMYFAKLYRIARTGGYIEARAALRELQGGPICSPLPPVYRVPHGVAINPAVPDVLSSPEHASAHR